MNQGVALSMFALNYQSASDKVLAQYVNFLSSKSGAALTLGVEEALDKSLSNASQLLGSGRPKVPGQADLRFFKSCYTVNSNVLLFGEGYRPIVT